MSTLREYIDTQLLLVGERAVRTAVRYTASTVYSSVAERSNEDDRRAGGGRVGDTAAALV